LTPTTTTERVARQPAAARQPGSGALTAPLAWIDQVGGMLALAGKAIIAIFSPPYSWRAEFVEEAWTVVRRCTLPAMLTTTCSSFGGPGMQADNLLSVFGSLDRDGALFVAASVRELSPFLTAMVVAGVAGTAICADLGARKVREEIDAIQVMGLDPVRELVAPRFLALGLATPLMMMVVILFGLLGGWIATVPFWHGNTAGFFATFFSNFTTPDLIGSVIKTSMFGWIIAIVCCYKGMNARGGAEGVGRAVNQAVVMAFVAIWVINYMFTTTMLAAYPEIGNLH
jgi:phospholipid/cholesterol/gamma-HCH transport system permease protein